MKMQKINFQFYMGQKTQNDYTKLLEDVERAKEEKENKQCYLSSIEKQTMEQGRKISRADKNLWKAHKEIQNLYISKRDNIILLQQVKRVVF